MRWVQLCGSSGILWHCLALGLEWKLTFSSPVATAKFSKFGGILSAALSQHCLLAFDSSAGIPSPPLALFIVMPRDYLHWKNWSSERWKPAHQRRSTNDQSFILCLLSPWGINLVMITLEIIYQVLPLSQALTWAFLHIYIYLITLSGLPWWVSGKESTCQCRRCGFDPWVGKIPWRKKW